MESPRQRMLGDVCKGWVSPSVSAGASSARVGWGVRRRCLICAGIVSTLPMMWWTARWKSLRGRWAFVVVGKVPLLDAAERCDWGKEHLGSRKSEIGCWRSVVLQHPSKAEQRQREIGRSTQRQEKEAVKVKQWGGYTGRLTPPPVLMCSRQRDVCQPTEVGAVTIGHPQLALETTRLGLLVLLLFALDERRRATCDGGYPSRGTMMRSQ